ncbi:hypothetical protein 1 [Beihai picorna-like virus 53]|uniref:hypothetical protein 1 n=1 Tax=Beihai picorna-like virus 53 TaxID=1922598 RepID=UPI00090A64B9|nr:hypothetical protein 1 [Beihai picorna-like virus 53]APG76849.1 hypothetical protein 1 [Beihai picorna-like virus 53]
MKLTLMNSNDTYASFSSGTNLNVEARELLIIGIVAIVVALVALVGVIAVLCCYPGEIVLPQGGEVLFNDKMARRNDAKNKQKNKEKDEIKRDRYLEKKNKSRNARRRAAGRRKKEAEQAAKEILKPEGYDYINFDATRTFNPLSPVPEETPNFDSRVDLAKNAFSAMMQDTLSSVLEKFDDNETMPVDQLVAAMVKVVGFIGPLATCRDKQEVTKVILAAVSQHITGGHVSAVRRYIDECLKESEPVPEGIDLEKVLVGFRDSAVEVRFLPMTKAIVSTLMLMVVSGMRPSSQLSDSKMTSVFQVWEDKIIDTLSFKNMSDCVAEIFEFAVHVVRAIKNGDSIKNLILPNTLHKQYAAIMPMRDHMYDNALEEKFNVTVEGYHSTVCELIDNMNYALSKSKSPQERTIYTRYVLDLNRLKKDVEDYLKNHQFREEPYVISLSGGSGLAKSSLVQQVIATYEQWVGYKVPESQIAYVKGLAKYDDNVTNATEIVVGDDVCNIMPSESERTSSFLSKLIEIVNNTPSLTNQAELSMKGRHYWRPKLVIVTTNVGNLMAPEISNKPYSLVRRLRHVEVTVKPEFATPGGSIDVKKVKYVKCGEGEILAPMHMMQWFHYEERGHNKQIHRVDEGPPMEFPKFLEQLIDEISTKKKEQKKYLASLDTLRNCERCPLCYKPKAEGWCGCCDEFHDASPEAGEIISYLATQGTHQFFYWVTNAVQLWNVPSFFPSLEMLMGLVFVSTASFVFARNQFEFGRPEMRGLMYALAYFVISFIVFVVSFMISPRFGLFFWPMYVIISILLSCVGIARVVSRNVMQDLRRRMQPGLDVNPVLRGMKMVGAIVCMLKLASHFKGLMDAKKPTMQGNLTPATKEEIEERQEEFNEWARPTLQEATPFEKGMTMTKEQAVKRVAANVWRFSISDNGMTSRGTVLFISSQLMVIAEHSFKKIMENMDLENTQFFFYKKKDQLGQQFSAHVVNFTNIKLDGDDSDHVLVKLSAGPTMPHIVDFFPEHKNHHSAFSMVFRNEDGTVVCPSGKYFDCSPPVKGLCGVWRGSRHTLSSPSEAGNCSSPAISWDKPHQILGLHSAGSADGKVAVIYCVTRRELNEAIDEMRCSNKKLDAQGKDVYPMGLTNGPQLKPYDREAPLILPQAHERAAPNWCPENGRTLTTFFGEVVGSRITPSSCIRDSILKEPLREEGVNVDYGPPKFNSDRTHSLYLNIRRDAMQSIPPSVVRMAVKDYLDPILDEIKRLGYDKGGFLSLDEVLNGVKGARFIGPINEKTSSGFGLKGKKERYLEIDYDLKDQGRKVFYPKPEISDRFNEMINTYLTGETCGSVLRSALKDETVKYDPETNLPKKEDRLFMSCGMADVFAQKSMFARVAEVMQSLPILTEMAVGINSTTDEWDQIYEKVIGISPDMVLAGDYSKYDVRLSGQIMRAAGYVLLSIAESIGYTPDQLKAMEAMIQECTNNYRIFGGCLISPDGYMPSGIFITLLLNCICNALIHRCAFYWKGVVKAEDYKKLENDFRTWVKMIFMGDDSLGSSLTTKFSMITVKEFCDAFHMAYTTGDKKLDIIPFISAEDAEFCKRGFYLHPKVGKRVGNLDVRSLIKSLCTYTQSVTTESTVLSETMDANLRELARHPQETFEKYREIYSRVAAKAGIRHMVKFIDRSYDEWWEVLGKVYRGEESGEPEWQPIVWSLDTLRDDEFL